MQLKNKKRAMIALMSLILATTGCSKKDDYKTNGFEKVQEIMDESTFYQKETYKGTYEEEYSSFYQNYLDKFVKYMSKEQYDLFINIVIGMDEQETFKYTNTYGQLNAMFDFNDNKEGRCFFQCFNTRIMGENFIFSRQNGLYGFSSHVATLRAVVNNDDEFFKSIYSKDINSVIDCISKNTGFENRELLEELILKMDLYYDLHETDEYMDRELMTSYENRVKEIISLIIESKCNIDETFNDSIYANILKNSDYFNQDTYLIVPAISEDTFYLRIADKENSYRIYYIDSKYLYESTSIEEIKRHKVNEIISQSMNPSKDDLSSVEGTMKLMMSIIDVDIFNNQELPDEDAMRHAMYENLDNYFTSEDDFNTFFLCLYDTNSTSLKRYFEIFIKRIEEDGISYNDFIRYLCLVNYNKEKTYTHIYFSGTFEEMQANYVPDDEIRLMKESEWKDIAYIIQENYFLGSIPYQDYFAEIEKSLANNDLGYELIYNPNCQYTWDNGETNITDLENCYALSAYIYPQKLEYDGKNIIYYEYPEDYQSSQAVETFYNIEGEFITREVSGYEKEIINPETGDVKTVFIITSPESLDEDLKIRFMLDYPTYMSNKKNESAKGLYLIGGNYE